MIVKSALDAAIPLGAGFLAIKDAPSESPVPAIALAMGALYILWQVLDRHVLRKGRPDVDVLHKSEATESLRILRSMKSKLDELVILLRDR